MILTMITALAMQAAPAPAPASTVAAPVTDSEKKLCRSQVTTGSIMGHRVCHTRAQWAAIDRAEADRSDDFRNKATNPGSPTL